MRREGERSAGMSRRTMKFVTKPICVRAQNASIGFALIMTRPNWLLPMEEEIMSDLTSEGDLLVREFLASQEALERARQDVNRAECNRNNAERALAKWLMPSDMEPGEKIGVWRGDSLFQVEMEPRMAYPVGEGAGEPVVTHEPKVTVRTRGKHFSDLRRRA
jgi:hypothetical protein